MPIILILTEIDRQIADKKMVLIVNNLSFNIK